MSLERTPPRSRELTAGTDSVNLCSICSEALVEDQDCVIIQGCSHIFHRICIENSLGNSSECPVCKRACQMSELRSYNLSSTNAISMDTPNISSASKNNPNPQVYKPPYKGRGRGGKVYNTRSNTRNLFTETQNSLNNTQEFVLPHNNNREQPISERTTNQTQNLSNQLDYNYISRMIEESVTRLLSSLTVVPPTGVHTGNNPSQHIEQNFVSTTGPGTASVQLRPPQQTQPNPSNQAQPNNVTNLNFQTQFSPVHSQGIPNVPSNLEFSLSPRVPFNVDKISSTIQGWNLKFDGSPNSLNVDEFLYRVKALTEDNFNGDFTLICKNLQILLCGRAREWLWRYRKKVNIINWEDFCQAIRSQYGDFKTSSDLREEIRNRKQKPGETFDIFFDSISAIIDRLDTPMTETETVETLTRNLRPEIRQDLLYINIRSVSQLRQLVHKRENFLNDEHVRKSIGARQNNLFPPRRQIAEINVDQISNDFESVDNDASINALHHNPILAQCWNCDEKGHHWQDCLRDRQVFCYGCGAKKIYKPNCTKCQAKTTPKNYNPSISREEPT